MIYSGSLVVVTCRCSATCIVVLMIRRPPRSTLDRSSAASDVYKRQNKYSAKPKNAWELGVHFGHFFIDGDVDRTIPGGYGLGLHLRKAIHLSLIHISEPTRPY